MPTMLDRLQEERTSLVTFVDETLTRANDEGRDLVDAEQRNLKTSQERILQLDAQIAPLVEFEQLRAATVQVDNRIRTAVRTAPRIPSAQEFRSFGDLYTSSEAFQSRGIQARVALAEIQASTLAFQSRAVLNTSTPPGSTLIPQPQQVAAPAPAFATPLLDVITRVPVTTGSVDLLTYGDFTGAAVVAEGQEKPEVAFVNGSTPTPLETIAGWIQYTRQLAQDATALATLLNQGLTRSLLRELQEQVATVITSATLPTTTGAEDQPMIEVIRIAMAEVQGRGFSPDVVLSSPQQLAGLDIQVLNLGGSAGTVLGNGNWNLRAIPVPGMTETIVADAASAFVLFERTGVEIYTTDSDIIGSGATAKSAFRSNVLTTLAETRAKAAVWNPNAAQEAVTVNAVP